MGRVLKTRCSANGLRFHSLRQRSEGSLSGLAGTSRDAHWGVHDPAAVKGTDKEIQRAFREAFVMLDQRITLFLDLPIASIDRLTLKNELDKIGRL